MSILILRQYLPIKNVKFGIPNPNHSFASHIITPLSIFPYFLTKQQMLSKTKPTDEKFLYFSRFILVFYQ